MPHTWLTSREEQKVTQLDVCDGSQLWLRSVRLAMFCLNFGASFHFALLEKQDDLEKADDLAQDKARESIDV